MPALAPAVSIRCVRAGLRGSVQGGGEHKSEKGERGLQDLPVWVGMLEGPGVVAEGSRVNGDGLTSRAGWV